MARYPKHWSIQIANLIVFGVVALRLTTQWAHTPTARKVEIGLMVLALPVMLWDWWMGRREQRATA